MQRASKTQVVVLTADAGFEEQAARDLRRPSDQIALTSVPARSPTLEAQLDLADATVAVIDLDAAQAGEMQALERLMARIGAWPPVVVVTQAFDAGVARTLLQMRVADFLVKPVSPVELVRTCARVAKAPATRTEADRGADLHLPAGGRRRRRHHARGAERDDAAQQRASAASRRPAWSISISSTAPAPTISISSRGSISARSSRGRSASTGNCSRSCCRIIRPAWR